MEINVASPFGVDEIVTGIDDARGGGLVEIVAFALRIAALYWFRYDGPLLLDEAYKSMSNDDKLQSVAEFLSDVSDRTERQIIFATHRAEVFGPQAEKVLRVKNINGNAQIEEVTNEDYSL